MKEIPLTQGKVVLVDDDMYEYLMQWNWTTTRKNDKWYAIRIEGGKTIRMHRVIINASDDMEVDHRDGNGLHNWRENLRECTHLENMRNRRKQKNNTTNYKGVSLYGANRYQAKIRVDGKLLHLGLFNDPIEAARAYDKAALVYFGGFAKTNF